MAFVANARVKVTSQHSEHRKLLGTVITPAGSSHDGFNKVRLDGFPVGRTVNLMDNEMKTTNFTSPVRYS